MTVTHTVTHPGGAIIILGVGDPTVAAYWWLRKVRSMNIDRFWPISFIFVMLTLISCAGGMSEQARSKVTYSGTFEQLQRQPEHYLRETVMWGGKVIHAKPLEKATELVVLQLELTGQDRPRDDDQSQGRYVVHSKKFLDPAIYPEGTLITVIGRFVSTDRRSIGEMDYLYPVIEVDEIKKWSQHNRQSPRFHFGIGVGTTF